MTIKVDLLDKPGRRVGFDPVIFILVIIIISCVIGFYAYGTTLDKKRDEQKLKVTELENKISEMQDKIPRITELEKQNAELEAEINTIKKLTYDPIRYANLMDEIAAIMPNNIHISNLNIEPTSQVLSFSGIAVEDGDTQPLDSISRFMQNIQSSRFFKSASLASTSRSTYAGRTSYGFSITTQYDPDVLPDDKQ